VYRKLEDYIGAKRASTLSEETTFSEIGFDQFTARKFWREFWVACDIPLSFQPGGSLENLLPDENFPKMPRTILEFIDQVAEDRRGTSYLACDECWSPG
jgi:hypothetical protein